MAHYDQIAERYANAIFDLATEAGEEKAMSGHLASIAGWLAADKSAQDTIQNPSVSNTQKKNMLRAAAKAVGGSPLLENALSVLAKNGRADKIPALHGAFAAKVSKSSNQIQAHVVSAKKLDAGTRKDLIKTLSESYEADIIINETVDASLIGGLRVQIGSKLIDGSVATRLNAMKNAMRAR